jgi:hypothetical protein
MQSAKELGAVHVETDLNFTSLKESKHHHDVNPLSWREPSALVKIVK